MNHFSKKLIFVLIAVNPLTVNAICIGPCTPNYSPIPNTTTDSLAATPINADTNNNSESNNNYQTQTKQIKHPPVQLTNTTSSTSTVKPAIVNNSATSHNSTTMNSITINSSTNNSTTNNTNKDNSSSGKNPFNFSLYQPTYILPLYYNTRPDFAVYQNNTPDNQALNRSEFDFQISFKVPLWQDIFSWPDTLYGAYTQDSYWQLYSNSPYFRETNYEPALFLDNEINKPIGGGWTFTDLDVGAMHQSNGRGGLLERSWNRAYFTTVFANGNWMVSIEPWTPIFARESSDEHNPDITHFLGYGEEMLAYNYGQNTFSFTTRNVAESGFSRGAEWLTWSFPLIHRNIKGYVYLFSGYGYDLIEYNHYTNGGGVGITLNDWM